MRLSYRWLSEFVPTVLSPEEIARLLTMAGLEVEGMEMVTEDIILEVNVTPNRGDWLSVLGVARELSAITGILLRMPTADIKGEPRPDLKVEVMNDELCRRYMGRVIKQIRIGPSPEWLSRRLENYGIRSINNIVDITNYVMVELGQPLHAFDLQAVKGGMIRVDAAKNVLLDFKTLDGVDRKLPPDAIVIADAKEPIALGGVMGGLFTEVQDSTRNILLEAAWFNPKSVRKTSKLLGLSSESSYRFERGTDIEMLPKALDRATALISELAEGIPSGVVDAYPGKFTPLHIEVNPERINSLLGTRIPESEMTEIFKRLNFEPEKKTEKIIITPPSYRLDIEIEADAAEEVARIHGYGNIPPVMPCTALSAEGLNAKYRFKNQVKDSIRKQGFNEAINYSFMNPETLDTLGIHPEDKRRRAVHIMNPLRQEEAYLRTMLAPGLIENLKYNFARGVREIRLFELGKVFFSKGKGNLPEEVTKAGGVFMRQKLYQFWKEPSEDDLYPVKGALEDLLDEFRMPKRAYSFEKSGEPFLHPGKSADIVLNGKNLGYLGVLSPALREKMDFKTKEEVAIFELDLDMLFEDLPPSPRYVQIPRFQYSERDIALIVDQDVSAGWILNLIENYPSQLIEGVALFDMYKGEKIPSGKKSLAFNIRYRAKDRTLTEEEVDGAHKDLLEYLFRETGGTLR